MVQRDRDIVGTSGAAREIERSATRVLQLVNEGRLVPAFITAEGRHYFRRADLKQFKRERRALRKKAGQAARAADGK